VRPPFFNTNRKPPVNTNAVCPFPRSTSAPSRVQIAYGHITSASDAEQLISNVDTFLYQVLKNRAPSKDQGKFRDEPLISYDREDGKISFIGLKMLFNGIRKDGDTIRAIRERQL